MKGLIGKKVGMTQVFDGDGNMVPVTIIDTTSCIVVGKRTPEKDKYSALTLGFGEAKEKKLNKPDAGHYKKAGAAGRKYIKEFRLSADDVAKFNVGDAVKPDMFAKGELVDVTGITKGRGAQGVVKRWKFRGFGQTNEDTERYDQPVLVRLNTKDEAELKGGFPKTAEELYQYHAIVIDDLEADFFTRDQMTLVQKFVSERGGGVLMLGGAESFREGNYAGTPIASMLPVYVDRATDAVLPTMAKLTCRMPPSSRAGLFPSRA